MHGYDGLVRGNVRNGLKPVLPRIMNGLPPPYRTITCPVTSGFIAGIRDTRMQPVVSTVRHSTGNAGMLLHMARRRE